MATKRTTKRTYSAADVVSLKETLKELAKKPPVKPDQLTLPELIRATRAEITAALKAGHSFEDIASAYVAKGVTCAPSTFRKAYFESGRGRGRAKMQKAEPSAPPAVPPSPLGSATGRQTLPEDL